MTAIKHPVLLWGLPVAALIIIFWLSLFCYSAIPVSGADATRALLPGHTPTLPEALVQNLRLPRSLVAVLIGASLALAGTLLQTLTHNPMASPSLLGINSGAALAMALTSALSPTPIAGYLGPRIGRIARSRGMRGRRELAAGHDRRRRISSYP